MQTLFRRTIILKIIQKLMAIANWCKLLFNNKIIECVQFLLNRLTTGGTEL